MPGENLFYTAAAIAVKKIIKATPGEDYDLSAAVVLSIGSKSLSYPDGWDATVIAADWNASTDALLSEITASTDGSSLILTHDTAGEDFEIQVTVDGETVVLASTVQTITFNAAAAGGTFTITFDGQTTGAITFNPADATATAAAIQNALEALTNVQVGDIDVTSQSVRIYDIDFSTGQYYGQEVSLITLDITNLTGNNAAPSVTTTQEGSAGVNEIQSLELTIDTYNSTLNEIQTLTMLGGPTGGDFTLTVPSYGTTAAIAYNASAATVQAALEGVVGSGNVACSGGPLDVRYIKVTFQGLLAGLDIGEMTADASGLTGGTSLDVTVTEEVAPTTDTAAIHGYTKPGGIVTGDLGDYWLVFANLGSPGGPSTVFTAAVDGDANAATLQAALLGPWDYRPDAPDADMWDTLGSDTKDAGVAYGPGYIFETGDVTITGDLTDGDNKFTMTMGGKYKFSRLGTNPRFWMFLINKTTKAITTVTPSTETAFVAGTTEIQAAEIVSALPTSGSFYLRVGSITTDVIALSPSLDTVAANMQTALNAALGEFPPEPAEGFVTVAAYDVTYGVRITEKVIPYPITEAGLSAAYGGVSLGTIFAGGGGYYNMGINFVGPLGGNAGAGYPGGTIAAPTTYAAWAAIYNAAMNVYLTTPMTDNYSYNSPVRVTYWELAEAGGVINPEHFEFQFRGWPFRGEADAALVEFLLSPGSAAPDLDIVTLTDGGTYVLPSISGGTYDLGIKASNGSLQWVTSIPYNSTAAQLQAAIESVLGAGSASCTGGPLGTAAIVIEFTGSYAKTPMNATLLRTQFEGEGLQTNEVIRTHFAPTEVGNVFDFTIIPGRGTPGLNLQQNWVDAADDCNWGTISITNENGGIASSYFRWAGCSPRDLENAINEIFGKKVCQVYEVVHSQVNATVGTQYGATQDHRAWYNIDVYRIVFVNDFAPAGSIVGMSFTPTPANAMGQEDAVSKYLTPDSGDDDDDYFPESFRTYSLFSTALARGVPIARWDIVPSAITGQLLTTRYQLMEQFVEVLTDQQIIREDEPTTSGVVSRALRAELFADMQIRFSWTRRLVNNVEQGATTYNDTHLLQTAYLPYDAPADQIQAALEDAIELLNGNVLVTGNLYNSWLPMDEAGRGFDEDSYNDLRITFINQLAGLPLHEHGYYLTMELVVVNPEELDDDFNLPNVHQALFCVPLHPRKNERQRLTLTIGESSGDTYIGYNGVYSSTPVTGSTTAAEIEELLTELSTLGIINGYIDSYLTNNMYAMMPKRYGRAVTVFGVDVEHGLEIEFTGAGFQSTDVLSIRYSQDDSTALVLSTTQEGVFQQQEVQVLSMSGSPRSGTFTLEYDGQTTGALNYNATAPEVQAALEALSNITPGDIAVTGGPLPAAIVVTFAQALNNVVAMTIASNSLVNATASAAISETGGQSGSLVVEETNPGAGPRWWNVPENWSTNRVPGSEDTAYVDDAQSPINFGLKQSDNFVVESISAGRLMFSSHRRVLKDDQKVYVVAEAGGTLPAGLAAGYYYIVAADKYSRFSLSLTRGGDAVALTDGGSGTFRVEVRELNLKVYSRFGGKQLGLPHRRSNGELEYLARYLRCGFTLVELGLEEGDGLDLCCIDGSDQGGTFIVHLTGSGPESSVPAVMFLFDSVLATLQQYTGEVGIAVYPEESSELKSIDQIDGTLVLGQVNVIDDITSHGGDVRVLQGTVGGNVVLR